MEIIKTMHVTGLQNFESWANTLNPFDTYVEYDKLWIFVARYSMEL